MSTADVKAFFDRVASDWDTMRIAHYDERASTASARGRRHRTAAGRPVLDDLAVLKRLMTIPHTGAIQLAARADVSRRAPSSGSPSP